MYPAPHLVIINHVLELLLNLFPIQDKVMY